MHKTKDENEKLKMDLDIARNQHSRKVKQTDAVILEKDNEINQQIMIISELRSKVTATDKTTRSEVDGLQAELINYKNIVEKSIPDQKQQNNSLKEENDGLRKEVADMKVKLEECNRVDEIKLELAKCQKKKDDIKRKSDVLANQDLQKLVEQEKAVKRMSEEMRELKNHCEREIQRLKQNEGEKDKELTEMRKRTNSATFLDKA